MKRYSTLFLLLLLPLNFITPTQKLQAHNSIQQDWGVAQANNLVFTTNAPQSSGPQVTVTAGQSKSHIPSIIAGKSNLPATLQNYNLVPIPDFKTGTVQEFTNYLTQVNCNAEQALNWHAVYMSDNFIAIIKQLPDYDQNLNKLIFRFDNQSDISEWFSRKFGSQPTDFKKRLRQLRKNREHEWEITQIQAAQRKQVAQVAKAQAIQLMQLEQARQKSQATIRQTWPENFELLQQDIPEWQELGEIFLEHKFGDSARLQKRIAVLNQLSINNNLGVSSSNTSNNSNSNSTNSSGNNNFITQSYNISPEINYVLQDTGLNHTDYTSCYGNPVQQLLHQENLDQLQQLGTLSPLSPIFLLLSVSIVRVNITRLAWCAIVSKLLTCVGRY